MLRLLSSPLGLYLNSDTGAGGSGGEGTNPPPNTGGAPGSSAGGAGNGNADGGGAGNGGTPPPGSGPNGGERTFTQADLDRIVKQRLDEDRKARQRQQEDEDARKRGEWEKVAQTEKERAEQAEARARRLAAKTEVLVAAQKANLVDPDVAFTLIEGQIEYSDAGDPTNVGKLIEQLAKDKPYLVGGGGGGGTSSPTNPPSGRSGTLTREAIEKMTPEQIAARWDEVQKVLAAG